MRPWFVYIAETATRKFYVGITNDPEERIRKHNSGQGSRFAKENQGLSARYVSSAFPDKSSARKRETQLKGWIRDKKLKLISGQWN